MRRPAPALVLAALATAAAVAAAAFAVRLGSDAGPASSRVTERSATTTHADRLPASAAKPGPVVRFTIGSVPTSVDIVRRSGTRTPRTTVLFLHGWGLTSRADYRAWLRHLAAMGNTVLAPRYLRSARDDPALVRRRVLRAVRRALERVEVARGSLVVVGHSAGAALAADYAAIARASGLPVPAAVFAVFPGRRILGFPGGIPEADPARIARSTRLVALAGESDRVVGQEPARALVARATTIPSSRRRFVLVSNPKVSDHLAPLRDTPPARAAFWRRLDRLIATVRSR